MTTRKDLVIAVLATFCLTSTLFIAIPTTSQPVPGQYDPWLDYNDDGIIFWQDLIAVLITYGASGEPINKTALLLELQARVDSLNASLLDLEAYMETRITTLEASVAALESDVATLQTTIAALESRIAALEAPGFMKAPAYDSGWLSIAQTEIKTLTHNLNTDPSKLLVYIVGWYGAGAGGVVHQCWYGGDSFFSGSTINYYGLMLYALTNTEITVYRLQHDILWPQVRVQIWIIQ